MKAIPTETGAWWLPDNITETRYYFDEKFADAIIQLTRTAGFSTLLDVGAGVGRYVRYYRNSGIRAHGIDGLNGVWNRSGGMVQQLDLSKPGWCYPHEIVTCMEVLEHMPSRFEKAVLNDINCAAQRLLVLSWALPGSLGVGHVNGRTQSYVRERLDGLGWRVDGNATRVLRDVSVLPWYRVNTFAFVRIDDGTNIYK